MDRRRFLATATVLAPGLRGMLYGPLPQASRSTTRLILLGTAGGPRPRATRSASAQVIIANDSAYVIDCGNGVARQLVSAGVPLRSIRGVFITHHHSDHNADYGTLLLLAATARLTTQVDTWGPPPLKRMTELFFQMSATDIVLSHLVPAEDSSISDDVWVEAARRHFRGRIILGRDLLEI
jgi:ribonuclease BN (tRNA processing enzyme)